MLLLLLLLVDEVGLVVGLEIKLVISHSLINPLMEQTCSKNN